MSANFIPAKDMASEKRREAVKHQLTGILSGYISGRGKTTKVEKAVDEIVQALEPHLRLGSKNDKGATIMTEAASASNKRPGTL